MRPTIYVLLVAIIAGVVGSVNVPSLWMLLRDGRQVHGSVVEVMADKHEAIYYQFSIGGKSYRGRDDGVSNLKVGDDVLVTYLPASPTISALGDVGSRLRNEIGSALLAALVIPAFLVFGNSRSRSRSQVQPQHETHPDN